VNGSSWSSFPSGTTSTLRAIWGSSSTDVHAVGDAGILHLSGPSWLPTSVTISMRAIWGSDANDVFAVGPSSAIEHFDGASLTQKKSNSRGPAYNGVWGSGSTDISVAADQGRIGHTANDGGTWLVNPSGVSAANLNGIWGIAYTGRDDQGAFGTHLDVYVV